jgi:hypothetical protein
VILLAAALLALATALLVLATAITYRAPRAAPGARPGRYRLLARRGDVTPHGRANMDIWEDTGRSPTDGQEDA